MLLFESQLNRRLQSISNSQEAQRQLEGFICHSGSSVLQHLTERSDWRPINVFLTRAILRICVNKSITNEVLFNTIVCRLLDDLLTQHDFTPKQLVQLAKTKNVVFPWSLEYDSLRTQPNQRFVYFPLIIAFPEHAQDIAFFVQLAKKHKLSISVRSGGHSAEGYASSGEMVIDLSTTKLLNNRENKQHPTNIRVDTRRNIVRMSAGVPLGVLNTKLVEKQRITPTGTCPGVSSGLFLGGGIGGFVRRFGLSSDQIVSMTVVLASGEVVEAKPDNEHADLLRALRGGGNGNFGIVAEISSRVFEATHVVHFTFVWPLLNERSTQDAAEIAALWHNRFLNKAPQSITGTTLRVVTGDTNKVQLIITGLFLDHRCQSPEKQKRELVELIRKYWFPLQQLESSDSNPKKSKSKPGPGRQEQPETKISAAVLPQPAIAEVEYITILKAYEIASGGQPQIERFTRLARFSC